MDCTFQRMSRQKVIVSTDRFRTVISVVGIRRMWPQNVLHHELGNYSLCGVLMPWLVFWGTSDNGGSGIATHALQRILQEDSDLKCAHHEVAGHEVSF